MSLLKVILALSLFGAFARRSWRYGRRARQPWEAGLAA
eukprot:CAMPEP_0119265154 /NCGR_PEP_ID=MMETSP1329-20130426/4051_1 /TAXON_ID=114041 /ORGANISM="Genus nov. species nov., Strain RCC1024" /LENGTH=37 /DNA_ID= /DNA_START= /DNA_END= /DNA_ORIENTATION=